MNVLSTFSHRLEGILELGIVRNFAELEGNCLLHRQILKHVVLILVDVRFPLLGSLDCFISCFIGD